MEAMVAMLEALSDRTRLQIFQCLRGCGSECVLDGETGYCEVCAVRCQAPCAPSTMSHHLNVLREAGLIESEKRGRKVYARVVPGAVERLARFILRGDCCPSKSETEVETHMENCPCCLDGSCKCEPGCCGCGCC